MGKKNSPRTSPSPESRFDQGQAMDGKTCFPVKKSPRGFVFVHDSFRGMPAGVRRHIFLRRHARLIFMLLALLGCLFLINSLIMSLIHFMLPQTGVTQTKLSIGWSKGLAKMSRLQFSEKSQVVMYGRLLDMASAVASDQLNGDSQALWEDPYKNASSRWKPCADKRTSKQKNVSAANPMFGSGYIFVTANGGLNQQRVAVCNAVAVASLLNATLVIPRFLYSSVWKDNSQFGDFYEEEHFVNILKDDINIIKELPSHLQNLDFESIGSLVTDADISKEAKPFEFVQKVLPILQKNGVVHFLGFGNRLAFDPVPIKLQRLRCKCNFHALQFAPKIQKTGSLLVQRIRHYSGSRSIMDSKILGNFMPSSGLQAHVIAKSSSKYLALHLRFEIDMVAYSMCDFGGGEEEVEELQAYRKIHFARMNGTKFVSPKELREGGRCPLTPEEAALMLSALGYKHDTYIYLAGSKIYGAQSRLLPFTSLYPNLVTKEDLLTPTELAPFRKFSSQMAALDFIACATADVFTMTDSGSQFSSLVTGYRTYYGGGEAPSIRPNNKRYAKILSESGTIQWRKFKERVRKMIEEGQRVQSRRVDRSIYRQPRCSPCMCKT